MSLKKLAAKFGLGSSATGPAVRVAAFGKHPAWDDHVEDIGLDSERLLTVKRWLYLESIARNIDSGAWDLLPEDQRLPGFDHCFWQIQGHSIVVGRLWPSRDGKGRSRYPMVLCVECDSLDSGWIAQRVPRALEQGRASCDGASTQDAVRDIIRRMQATLSAEIPKSPSDPPTEIGPLTRRLVDCPALGPDRIGLYRIVYHIDRECGSFRAGSDAKSRLGNVSHHLRVPACDDDPYVSAGLWASFVSKLFVPNVPLLAISPMRGGWTDFVFGDAGPQQLFCLRAGASAIPLASEIPYHIEHHEVMKWAQELQVVG